MELWIYEHNTAKFELHGNSYFKTDSKPTAHNAQSNQMHVLNGALLLLCQKISKTWEMTQIWGRNIPYW